MAVVTEEVLTPPTLNLPSIPANQGQEAKVLNDSQGPLYMRLSNRLQWWKRHASPLVVYLIKHRLPTDYTLPPPRPRPLFHVHTSAEIQDALAIVQEYLEVKAVGRVHLHSGMHFVPWFVSDKPKPWFISACVDINARLRLPPYFRWPNRGKIFPYLVKGHWALKIE